MAEAPNYRLFDSAGAAGSVFFPRPDHSAPPLGAEDVMVDAGGGIGLAARFYRHAPDLPTILYWHGNGEVVGDHDAIAPLYHEAGANLFVVDFRGYGKSTGSPTFGTLVSDGPVAARAMLEHLNVAGFGGRRFIMGRSLGSHPAIEVAARMADDFAGLVIESGASSIAGMAARLGGAVDREEIDALVAAHEAKIRSITMPALILHGEQDQLIPVERAAWLHATLGSESKELLVIPGAGHNDILWVGRTAYFDAIKRFVGA